MMSKPKDTHDESLQLYLYASETYINNESAKFFKDFEIKR
jgi:hypothetical protein